MEAYEGDLIDLAAINRMKQYRKDLAVIENYFRRKGLDGLRKYQGAGEVDGTPDGENGEPKDQCSLLGITAMNMKNAYENMMLEMYHNQANAYRTEKENKEYKSALRTSPITFSDNTKVIIHSPEGDVPLENTVKISNPSPKKESSHYDKTLAEWRKWITKDGLENSKNNPYGGWDKDKNVWRPHKSYEGGASTIGHGFKTSANDDIKKAIEKGYITEEEDSAFIDKRFEQDYFSAKSKFDKEYGDGEFEKLPIGIAVMLIDKEFNIKDGGLSKYPNLMKAAYERNYMNFKNNTHTKSTVGEYGRNTFFDNYVDSLNINGDFSTFQ